MELIPLSKPFLDSSELTAVARVLESGHLHGNGPISDHVQSYLCNWLSVPHALLTTSCTHALEMAMMALDIGPGDEVVMPSFTFVSAANAVILRGAKVVFADICEDTLNVDPSDVARKTSDRTKAIVPVHYAGVACDIDAILDIARARECFVVEDAAQAVDAKIDRRYLGTIGDIGCFSFHDTKNITCGEGGAFLTHSQEIAEKAETIYEKGTNRSAFLRGEIDKYTWVRAGSSYIPSEILAAVLEVQLAKRNEIRKRRQHVWQTYLEALGPLATEGLIRLPVIPANCESNFHMFFFRVATQSIRDELLKTLKGANIGATFHYVPLHSSPYGRNALGDTTDLPITDHCSKTLIRLPIYPGLASQADHVAGEVRRILESYYARRSDATVSKPI